MEHIWATEEEANEEFHSRTFPGPSPLVEMQRQYQAMKLKHICNGYVIRDGRTVCPYCGKEMEL